MIEKNKIFDLIVVGAGPAGLSASIYASRYGLKHLIVGSFLGGQISETHEIDNYPGMENMSGFEFSQKWGKHVKKYGTEIYSEKVEKIIKKEDFFELKTENKNTLTAKTIILATGVQKRKLNISGEEKFLGKGVSYCATCDGFFYKDKIVGVIGGSDSAATAALYLADITKKIYLIYRRDKLRAEPFWINLIKKNKKIEILYNTNIVEFLGQEKLEKIKLDKKYNNSEELNLDGVFIEAGSVPDISFFQDLKLEIDKKNQIKIKPNGETNITGLFAAGDITNGSNEFRQVITAAAEGAIAARSAYNFLQKN